MDLKIWSRIRSGLFDGGITEGMNEKGLVINGLFCKGTPSTTTLTRKDGPRCRWLCL